MRPPRRGYADEPKSRNLGHWSRAARLLSWGVVGKFTTLLLILAASCGRSRAEAHAEPTSPRAEPTSPRAEPTSPRPAPDPSAQPQPSAPAPERAAKLHAAPALNRAAYPWLQDKSLQPPPAVESLSARFAPPAGFTRVALAPESFGAWLRGLPLAPKGTPVRSFDGHVLHSAGDPRIAAVVAIDVGHADLQQCADAVIRLDAEWQWSRGRRDESYRAASGLLLPFSRWARGERLVAHGSSLAWQHGARPRSDHAAFRAYLDAVFAWANTVSVAREARHVEARAIAPGDFFIMPGNPGHTVLVLDMARSADGRRVALIGQSYMPAQSYQVLRPRAGAVWFALDASQPVATPFWEPFPWTTLERFPR
jgi:Domain of unknown function (4846)